MGLSWVEKAEGRAGAQAWTLTTRELAEASRQPQAGRAVPTLQMSNGRLEKVLSPARGHTKTLAKARGACKGAQRGPGWGLGPTVLCSAGTGRSHVRLGVVVIRTLAWALLADPFALLQSW